MPKMIMDPKKENTVASTFMSRTLSVTSVLAVVYKL